MVPVWTESSYRTHARKLHIHVAILTAVRLPGSEEREPMEELAIYNSKIATEGTLANARAKHSEPTTAD